MEWCQAVLRYVKEEAIGKNIMDLIIPKKMHTAVAEMIRHGAKTGEMPPTGDFSLQRKDGTRVPVLSAHVITNWLICFRDIAIPVSFRFYHLPKTSFIF